MTEKTKVINVKVDDETKSKLETLAYLKGMKLQSLCEQLIQDAIIDNADVIADAEQIRAKFKK